MKHILVTGASGNLGFAVTQKLTSSGYHVIAVDASEPRKAYLDAEQISTFSLDLSDADAVSGFVEKLDKDLHAAVLTVGGFGMGGFQETDVTDIQKMIRLNFETAWHLVKGLLPKFLEQGSGQFILIGARPALEPSAGKDMIAYSLSKRLTFSLSDLINAESKDSPVHSTVIVPSVIDTPANRKSMPDADFSKWVSAEKIAETIDFLLGDTGSVLREPIIRIYNES